MAALFERSREKLQREATAGYLHKSSSWLVASRRWGTPPDPIPRHASANVWLSPIDFEFDNPADPFGWIYRKIIEDEIAKTINNRRVTMIFDGLRDMRMGSNDDRSSCFDHLSGENLLSGRGNGSNSSPQ